MKKEEPRTLAETVAFNIRKYRKILGMTQEELATAIDTTKSAISKYELGRRFPDADTMDDLAKALGISPLFLIADEELAAKTLETLNSFDSESSCKRIADEMMETGGYYRRSYLDAFNRLNDAGQQKAIERVEELAEIPKYTKRFDALTPEEKKLAESGQWGKLWQLQFGEDAPVDEKED